MTMNNDDLDMTAFQSGDESAFNGIVSRNYEAIRAWAFNSTRDWQESEDLTQDVFMAISSSRHTYVPGSQFRAWMWRIAKSKAIDAHRRRKSDSLRDAIMSSSGPDGFSDESCVDGAYSREPDPCEAASTSECCGIAKQLAESLLPQEQLETLTSYCNGESLPQIAKRMGARVATTKSRLRIARENILRTRLEGAV